MHDIKAIRDNPERFVDGWAKRFLDNPQKLVDKALSLDEALRAAVTQKQLAEATRNQSSKMIGKAKAAGDDAEFERLREEVALAKSQIEAAGENEDVSRRALQSLLEGLPNIPAEDVPSGEDEAANIEIEERRFGTPRRFNFEPKDHVSLGEALGQMDFETAAKMSGARFVLLSGTLARLERALAQFMLDTHISKFGYTEVAPPILVRDEALYGTGQLPKFAEDSFQTKQGHWLVPTAEVPLTNIVAGSTLTEGYLPRRYTAWTPCFRSEAGSAGRDTRGMIRLHQFQKVELVCVCAPEASDAEHHHMLVAAEHILKALELPFRTMLLSSGDMGFGARKTYDLEVWIPSQNTYREISSVSNCGDFQARRMNARFKREGEKKSEFLHTLNGSGLAVGRTLVALLENYQQEDGSIMIPDVLRPYMDGLEAIAK